MSWGNPWRFWIVCGGYLDNPLAKLVGRTVRRGGICSTILCIEWAPDGCAAEGW